MAEQLSYTFFFESKAFSNFCHIRCCRELRSGCGTENNTSRLKSYRCTDNDRRIDFIAPTSRTAPQTAALPLGHSIPLPLFAGRDNFILVRDTDMYPKNSYIK